MTFIPIANGALGKSQKIGTGTEGCGNKRTNGDQHS